MIAAMSRAEDSDRFRPYIHFRSAEFNTAWGVQDGWGFGFGANFNQHIGLEFALDSYEKEFEQRPLGQLGEESLLSLVTQMRLRYPLVNRKVVPYVLAGAGVGFTQFNDRRPPAFGLDIDADDTSPVVAVGTGVDLFLADNIAFNLEAKYLWVTSAESRIDGRRHDLDMSAPLVTMGVRAYFSENRPRPMAELEETVPGRAYFGARFGGSILADKNWAPGVSLDPEVSAWLGKINHSGGLSLGVNLGTVWGVELAADFTEFTIVLDDYGAVGEYSVYTIVPHLRLRWPLGNARWVPYLMAGVGVTYGEDNDRKESGAGLGLTARNISPALSVGAGMEYFFARNFSFNVDMRWMYTWGHGITAAGNRRVEGDFSALNVHLGFRVYLLEF